MCGSVISVSPSSIRWVENHRFATGRSFRVPMPSPLTGVAANPSVRGHPSDRSAVGRFDGRNVIVTGGSRGIGRAIAAGFLAEGARVLVADRDARGLERLREELDVESTVADLGTIEDPSLMVAGAIERFGRVHVLVNNAGVMPDGPALDVTPATFDTTFAVNVRGPFLAMQEAARHMIAHGGGAIVNVASANAFRIES